MAVADTPQPAASPDRAYLALLKTIGLFRRVMDPYFARFGISQAQWAVLISLHCAAKNGEPAMRLADLGERLLIRPPSVTHVVERLRAAGMVVRECSPTDNRSKVVRLTVAGQELVGRILDRHGRQIESVMAGLDGHEQATLKALLDKLNTHLERVVPRDDAHAVAAADEE